MPVKKTESGAPTNAVDITKGKTAAAGKAAGQAVNAAFKSQLQKHGNRPAPKRAEAGRGRNDRQGGL